MRPYTDDERAIMRAYQDVIDTIGRAIATIRARGGSRAEEMEADRLQHAARVRLHAYCDSLGAQS